MVLHLLPLPQEWEYASCSKVQHRQKQLHLQSTSLPATSSYSIRGGKGWPGSKGRLSIPLFSCVHARQDASSRPPLPPLLWLWLPPDVTPLLVTAQTFVADFVVSVYLSQLFSLAVKFMEFHTLLNHTVFLFHERGNIQEVVCVRVGRGKMLYLTWGKFVCVYHLTPKYTKWNQAQFYRAQVLGSPFQSQEEVHWRCTYWLISLT